VKGVKQKPVAVIGDSTFLHSGITWALIDMVYNGGDALVVSMNTDDGQA